MGNRALLGIVVVALLGAGGFWWFTQQAEAPMEDITVVTPRPAAPPAPVVAAPDAAAGAASTTPGTPAPGAATPPPESDALALGEEEIDRIKAETADLSARAADLQEQVRDGKMLIDAQAQKIAKLEAELKKMGVKPVPPKKP